MDRDNLPAGTDLRVALVTLGDHGAGTRMKRTLCAIDGSIMTPSHDTCASAYRLVLEELYVRAFHDPFEVGAASVSGALAKV
jgi:hypothetical protein